MRNKQQGFIDPYGLGFIVIVIGALAGGIQNSWEDQEQSPQNISTNSTLSEQASEHKASK